MFFGLIAPRPRRRIAAGVLIKAVLSACSFSRLLLHTLPLYIKDLKACPFIGIAISRIGTRYALVVYIAVLIISALLV